MENKQLFFFKPRWLEIIGNNKIRDKLMGHNLLIGMLNLSLNSDCIVSNGRIISLQIQLSLHNLMPFVCRN